MLEAVAVLFDSHSLQSRALSLLVLMVHASRGHVPRAPVCDFR